LQGPMAFWMSLPNYAQHITARARPEKPAH
jgi:hypothetical protein